MKLKLEKDVKVAVEINGQKFVGLEDGILYQSIDDKEDEVFIFIKSSTDNKEMKIKMIKEKEPKIIDDDNSKD